MKIAMTQAQTSENSAEILRLTLPLMSKHSDGFRPTSYAIWYEYVQGGNPDLKAEIDATISSGDRLTEAVTFDLYQRYIVDRTEQAVTQARTGLLQLLESVNRSVDDVAGNTVQFTHNLHSLGSELQAIENVDQARERIDRVALQAASVAQAFDGLNEKFLDSQATVQKLVDELVRARQEVLTDPLTGLTNRRGFDGARAMLSEELRSTPSDLAVLMIDIDHFKRVNDTYGHLFGDQVIRGVAQAVKACVKGKDVAARYGGEEFVVLLPATGLRGAQAVAEQIRLAVERSRIRKANSQEAVGNITVSVGLTVWRSGEDLLSTLERADQALYTSKQQGRNRITPVS
jgi:diguanylate cyclase